LESCIRIIRYVKHMLGIAGSTERLMPRARMAGRPAAARRGKDGRAADPLRGVPGEACYDANGAT
jgi:hypothetical protein